MVQLLEDADPSNQLRTVSGHLSPVAGSRLPAAGSLHPMLDRLWWFVTGVFAGGVVTVRALRRAPNPVDFKAAATLTTADVMAFAARRVRPPRRVVAIRSSDRR